MECMIGVIYIGWEDSNQRRQNTVSIIFSELYRAIPGGDNGTVWIVDLRYFGKEIDGGATECSDDEIGEGGGKAY